MTAGVHCIHTIKTRLETFIVGSGTHRRNERVVNYDPALLTRMHMHFGKFYPCAEKSPIVAHFGLAADTILIDPILQ